MKETNPITPFRSAGSAVMLAQCRKMQTHMPGVLSGEDPEDLRRMRIASRRLRAAMKLFRDCFPSSRYELWYGRVSDLTDALGQVRDHDVQAGIVCAHREALPPEHLDDIDRWMEAHALRRAEAHTRLVAALDSWAEKGMMGRLHRVLVTAAGLDETIARRAAEAENALRGYPGRSGLEAPAEEDVNA